MAHRFRNAELGAIVMNNTTTPPAFYAYSADFDYRKYLEERSHSDRIVMSVDDQSAAIIGGTQALAKKMEYAAHLVTGQVMQSGRAIESRLGQIDNSLLRIDTTLRDGFETVSADLRNIGDNIVDMHMAMNEGFTALLESSNRTNNILSHISHLIETPDQVWANEKFKAARTCSERGLWSEALEFVTLAIEGDERHSGFKLEPSYYFLRGRILEGAIGTEIELVDLAAAKGDFMLAYRYCSPTDHYFRRLALTRAAWCCYCLGNFSEAEQHLIAAIKLPAQLPESNYILAKVRIRAGKMTLAQDPLASAIYFDSVYAYRAINDPDFTPHLAIVREWLSQQRDLLHKKVREWKKSKIQPGFLIELAELHEKIGGTRRRVDEYLQGLECLEGQMTLTELVDLFVVEGKQGVVWEQQRKELINALALEIDEHVRVMTSFTISKVFPNVEVKSNQSDIIYIKVVSTLGGGLIGLLIAVYFIVTDGGFEGVFGMIITGFFGLIVYGIPGIIVGLIVGWLAGFPISKFFDDARIARDRVDQQKKIELAQAKFRKEEEILAGKRSEGKNLKIALNVILLKLGIQRATQNARSDTTLAAPPSIQTGIDSFMASRRD